MCNRFRTRYRAQHLKRLVETQLEMPLLFAGGPEADLDQEMRPTDFAPALVVVGERAVLGQASWGHKTGRGPQLWTRADGLKAPTKRALVLVSEYYEFTGEKSPKTRWTFNVPGAALVGFPVPLHPAEGNTPATFSLYTLPPGPVMAPVHDREAVLLDPADWSAWLTAPPEVAATLLAARGEGRLRAEAR